MEYAKLFRKTDILSNDVAKKAEEELNETPERRETCIQELRDLLDSGLCSDCYRDQQISEHFCGTSDLFLCGFLRAKKYDVKKAYELLDSYLKFRERYPDLTSELSIDSVRPALERGYPRVLPARDNQGRIVFLFSIGSWDANEVPFDDVLRAYIYLLEALLENAENQVSGFVIVENFQQYTISQAMSLKPSDLQKMVNMLQGAFPIRFKGVHFLYQPWYFSWTYALVRPFMKTKMTERVHIHGSNLEKFHQVLDPCTLPPDFGGNGPEFSPLEMITLLEKIGDS
ncbi:retinaldehyde-binding protein 1-like [Haliotis asinina]|uniref:retinaldehyde-binding protein 1-like n=1 Tax=Haliotis asinina TaxID=109174 RepID=UPI0035318FE4